MSTIVETIKNDLVDAIENDKLVLPTLPEAALQVREIAEKKMQDLSAVSVEAAMRTVEGSARSMGIEVVE